MPAGAVATGVPGEDIIDLGVCIKLLKKSIVLIPLVIMIVIYVIKVRNNSAQTLATSRKVPFSSLFLR